MNFKKKYKFDNTNTLLLLTDENNIKKYNDIDELIANNDMGLGDVAWEIIGMVLSFGKWACLGMGTKAMIETMLAGGNVKDATGAGVQYFIFYIVLNIYPKLFSMLKF